MLFTLRGSGKTRRGLVFLVCSEALAKRWGFGDIPDEESNPPDFSPSLMALPKLVASGNPTLA
jgi:hypothetical protein